MMVPSKASSEELQLGNEKLKVEERIEEGNLRKEVIVLPVHHDLSMPQIDWMAQKVSKLILMHENA